MRNDVDTRQRNENTRMVDAKRIGASMSGPIAPNRQLTEAEIRDMLKWFKKRVPLPEFDLVLVDKETSLHGKVETRNKNRTMTLYKTGRNEDTVIHELAHLLAPAVRPRGKREYDPFLGWVTSYPSIESPAGSGRYRVKPTLIHGAKFKAAQARLWELWARRSESEELNGGAA